MRRQPISILLALLCGILIPTGGASQEPKTKPNILFILADDVGREVLGCYGGSSYETPRIDSLADSGMKFTNAYVMPVCHPTRVALLSGQYPFQLGNPEWGTYPKKAEGDTLPNVLKRAGYSTAVAGKWQLALLKNDLGQPHRMGFDEYCLFGWHEGARYHSPFIYQNGKLREGLQDAYGPEVYTDFLIDFMKDCKTKQTPFFAFYSMALCHNVTDDLDGPVPFAPHGKYDDYHQMVEQMDRMVGKMIDAIENLGIAGETMIVFLTDNGTPKFVITDYQDGKLVEEPVTSRFGDREIPGGKGDATDWGTRVPLLVRWDGVVEGGSATEAMVDSVDFFPTFAEAGKARLPKDISYFGKSFLPILTEESNEGREWVFAGRNENYFVRTNGWKLHGDGRLFDMATDPDEQEPLGPGDGAPEKAKEARTHLQSILESLKLSD
ncbi:MAG: sulfatase-like hydrolase/transferase [Candidatus Omnitrophica bacterium]|nr:sulfatase-like hydrolase/transferase [Candidatus Omnitrophota bacterium]